MTKQGQDLHTEKCQTLLREIKDPNKQRDTQYPWMRRFNDVSMSVFAN